MTIYRRDFSYITESFQVIEVKNFFSDRMSYKTLRGLWCNIIVLNARAPTEDKDDDIKESFTKN
jgi:hypothetical protein